MSGKSCWELIEQKKFEEACIKADEEYLKGKSLLPLRNKVIALMNLKRYEEVITSCQKIIELTNGNTDSEFIYLGMAKWVLNDIESAIDYWRKGLNAYYTDAAGGIIIPALLYFASVKLKDKTVKKEASRLLKKRWKSRFSVNWPGAVAGFLLNELDDRKFIESVSSEPTLQRRQLCQANFYVALKYLEQGEVEKYINHLTQCTLSEYGYLEDEYYLAIGELDKIAH
jgi:tetratricopeptide (TPR) repeat protein